LKDEDIYFCTADPGWVTGHSYIVYGPLLNGATVLFPEGAPDYPDPGRWWSLVEKYDVSILYTTPTAIRSLMKRGDEWPAKYDLGSLRILGTVGEPINPEAWLWYYRVTGQRHPIMDTWWQTETGMTLITPLPCASLKPGSATRPFPGIVADVVDKEGQPVAPKQGGFLVIKTPWPSMMRTIYKDPQRYEQYWKIVPNVYTAGDVAYKDEDGYFWILGRADDVIKVSGYRLGTAEIESALVSHPAVAEAAAIGKPDPVKGEAIKTFVILKAGYQAAEALVEELKAHVRHTLGPIAVPSELEFVDWLPKTRSGKIMRRVLKAKETGVDPGDISTLEE
jgi:acetyl-CoA synthetase